MVENPSNNDIETQMVRPIQCWNRCGSGYYIVYYIGFTTDAYILWYPTFIVIRHNKRPVGLVSGFRGLRVRSHGHKANVISGYFNRLNPLTKYPRQLLIVSLSHSRSICVNEPYSHYWQNELVYGALFRICSLFRTWHGFAFCFHVHLCGSLYLRIQCGRQQS